MPNTAWKNASPREYGFYSNVNPDVDHPRWSQATERVIGESILAPRIKTLMFNGYGDEVAHLYSCLLYTSPSPRDRQKSRMPSSA